MAGEMSLPVSYLVRMLIVAFFGWNALRVFRYSHGMSLLQAVVALAFVYFMFIQPTHVYLKKWKEKKAGTASFRGGVYTKGCIPFWRTCLFIL